MDFLDVSELQVIGGLLMLAGLFVLREFASGALKKAGEEFWLWVRQSRSGQHAEVNRSGSEHGDRGADDVQTLCLRPLGPGEALAAAPRQPPVDLNANTASRRKSV